VFSADAEVCCQLWQAGRRVKVCHVALAGAVAAALILPRTVRNYLVFDRFLLLNSQAGQVLWNANHPERFSTLSFGCSSGTGCRWTWHWCCLRRWRWWRAGDG
jgi:hypothetical protein